MQLRLPRAKDAAPRKKRPPIVSTADSPVCGICHKQISQYTCPKCNLPYCSLACFRSPEHQACTETFDRTTLADDLNGDKDGSEIDKRQMLEMLKKFEDQQRELEELRAQQGGETGADEDEDEEDDSPDAEARRRERQELEKRLAEVDLDALPPEQILSLLSPAQQQAFTEALQDPTRISKLVEDEFEGEEPWWTIEQERKAFEDFRDVNKEAMRPDGAEGDESTSEGAAMAEEPEIEWEVVRPPLLDPKQLPPLKVGPDGKSIANPHLLHNIVAVLFAYSFTLRTFSLTSLSSIPSRSPERITIVQVLAQLLPFLVQRSGASFIGLEDAIEYVAAREEPQGMSPPLIALLLQDVASLLRPAPIAAIASADEPALASHALVNMIAALSDVHALFASANAPSPEESAATGSTSSGPTVSKPLIARPSTTSPLTKQERQQCSLASAKLLFYTSFAVSTGNEVVQACGALAALAERGAARRAKEEQEREEAVARRRAELKSRGQQQGEGGAGDVKASGEQDQQPQRAAQEGAKEPPRDGGGKQDGMQAQPLAGPKIVELE
ncbi:hypothetical protein JCM10908_000669 [Rhodotorula pacifica]|uniref:Hit1p n=1 Tax=Rhodotorula pacifica TaxID=1495444 RepID=UPI00317AC782